MYATMIYAEKDAAIDANDKACSIFGYLPGEMNNIALQDVFDTNSHPYIAYAVALSNTGKAKGNITCIRKNGERFPCAVRSLVFMDDNGMKQIFTTIFDVSRNYSTKYFG
jgi:PAS domain S-box-containing protein